MADSHELFECSICLQLLDDPGTTACGHSYCIKCINAFWDVHNDSGRSYSCPQCRQTFTPRPDLKRNTLLATVLEDHKRTNSLNAAAAAAAEDTYAAPGDVPCDACTGRKRKACKFCLVCLASYCETHLQPHFEVPPLKKHNLIQASARIKDSICGRHDKLLEIYCRTDQQFICLLCVVDEHKGHDAVAVAVEKCEMQKRLEGTKEEIADRVLNSERKMAELRQAAGSIRERLRKEKKEQQERKLEQKKIAIEEKIQEWLKVKREQEKQEQLLKLSKEEEEMQRLREKRRVTEQRAQQKYKDWLQKKNQEKIEMEKKEKEEAALKKEQEKERHKRAQEKFKDWLANANEKSRASPKSPCYPTSPYDNSYPSPSFCNPVPWKPIHVPPPETPLNKTAGKKSQKQRKCQQSPSTAFRLRNSQLLQRR